MTGWRAKLDWCLMMVGGVVASVGLFAQLAGFALAFLFGDPITGDLLLSRGFWVAGLGGAGLVYGMQVDAGGSVAYPGGPVTYTPNPLASRKPARLHQVLLPRTQIGRAHV